MHNYWSCNHHLVDKIFINLPDLLPLIKPKPNSGGRRAWSAHITSSHRASVARSEQTITLMINNVLVCVWKYVNPSDWYAGMLFNQYCLRSLFSINECYRIRAPLPLMSFAIGTYPPTQFIQTTSAVVVCAAVNLLRYSCYPHPFISITIIISNIIYFYTPPKLDLNIIFFIQNRYYFYLL